MLNCFNTSNYDDFGKVVKELFGGGYKTFFGHRRRPHDAEVIVYATDNHIVVRLHLKGSLPETFPNEHSRAVAIGDIDEFDVD